MSRLRLVLAICVAVFPCQAAFAQEFRELTNGTMLEGFNAACLTTVVARRSGTLIGLAGGALNGAGLAAELRKDDAIDEVPMAWSFNVSGNQILVQGIRYARANTWKGASEPFIVTLRRTGRWSPGIITWGGGGIPKQKLKANLASGTLSYAEPRGGVVFSVAVEIQTIGCEVM